MQGTGSEPIYLFSSSEAPRTIIPKHPKMIAAIVPPIHQVFLFMFNARTPDKNFLALNLTQRTKAYFNFPTRNTIPITIADKKTEEVSNENSHATMPRRNEAQQSAEKTMRLFTNPAFSQNQNDQLFFQIQLPFELL